MCTEHCIVRQLQYHQLLHPMYMFSCCFMSFFNTDHLNLLLVTAGEFAADGVKQVPHLCSSSFQHSTPYHFQTNGLTECTNRTFMNMLSMYISSDHKDWDSVLPFVTYAFSTAQHESTSYRPSFLPCARPPCCTMDGIFPFLDHVDSCICETICRAEEAQCAHPCFTSSLWLITSADA